MLYNFRSYSVYNLVYRIQGVKKGFYFSYRYFKLKESAECFDFPRFPINGMIMQYYNVLSGNMRKGQPRRVHISTRLRIYLEKATVNVTRKNGRV